MVERGSYNRRAVSIFPQSRASLAAHFNLITVETHQGLVSCFKSIGIDDVLDTLVESSIAVHQSEHGSPYVLAVVASTTRAPQCHDTYLNLCCCGKRCSRGS